MTRTAAGSLCSSSTPWPCCIAIARAPSDSAVTSSEGTSREGGCLARLAHQIATNANQPLHDRRSLGQGDDGDRAHHFLDLRRWQGVADTSDIEHEYVHVNLGSASTLSLQRSPTAGLASLHDVSGWRETAEL